MTPDLARRLTVLVAMAAAAALSPVTLATAQHAPPAAQAGGGDSTSVAGTVQAFHAALGRGDSAAALALLADDVRILESGALETLAEYRGHHLPGDIEYARAVPSTRGPVHVTVRGDVAWAVSTSDAKGEFRGRAVSATGAELMVLTRTADGWRISAIHWSSRRRPT